MLEKDLAMVYMMWFMYGWKENGFKRPRIIETVDPERIKKRG